jgi:hypothetical protein
MPWVRALHRALVLGLGLALVLGLGLGLVLAQQLAVLRLVLVQRPVVLREVAEQRPSLEVSPFLLARGPEPETLIFARLLRPMPAFL